MKLTCPGIIWANKISKKIKPLPGNLSRASAYPAIDANKMVVTTLAIAIKNELSVQLRNKLRPVVMLRASLKTRA